MYYVYTVENYRAGTLTISGINGLQRVVDGQKANFLAVELVDIFEIEDWGIYLANKKVNQLINEDNKAKYYYD